MVVKMVHYAILKKGKKCMGNEITIEEKKKMLRVLQSRIHRQGKNSGKLKISLLYTYQNLIFLMRIE